MLTIKLALRNIISAGLRTWLSVFILSIGFVAIIFSRGMITGSFGMVKRNMIDTELGGGQFWYKGYEPFDPLTVKDAHAPISPVLAERIADGSAVPILVTSAAMFPEGRIQSVLIKGVLPEQQTLQLPTHHLKQTDSDIIPAMIGSRMAHQSRLNVGDEVTVRWRDVHGTFDALDIRIAHIMKTTNPAVDNGQVWISLPRLQEMLHMPDEATMVVMNKGFTSPPDGGDAGDGIWLYRDLGYLLKEIDAMIRMKKGGNTVMFAIILGMGLLAIFDTQVLAIFRRQKEMGTLMALGMDRGNVIRLFTMEGAMHGILALVVGAIYGIPLLSLAAIKGIPLPQSLFENAGFAMGSHMYPVIGVPLWMGTTLVVLVTVTLVSYLPTRKITHLRPTDALRGRRV
jgi:putative ABC transport system permease protein